MFEKINLYTSEGKLVTTIDIPVFKPRYEVLIWGIRVFVWNEPEERYKEKIAYVVVPQQ